VIDVDDADFESPPETLDASTRELVCGVYKLEKRLLLVLDVDRALQLPVAAGAVAGADAA
jgi:purine-binding chemotaxis protein CheW